MVYVQYYSKYDCQNPDPLANCPLNTRDATDEEILAGSFNGLKFVGAAYENYRYALLQSQEQAAIIAAQAKYNYETLMENIETNNAIQQIDLKTQMLTNFPEMRPIELDETRQEAELLKTVVAPGAPVAFSISSSSNPIPLSTTTTTTTTPSLKSIRLITLPFILLIVIILYLLFGRK